MKLKEYKFKYKNLELMIQDDDFFYMLQNIKLLNYEEAVKAYGEYEILSVMNFNDSKTTSVVLERLVH